MNSTLEAWIKREAEVIAANRNGAGSGFCTPQQIEGKTGREILEAMMRGALPVPYSARHENILAVEIGDGLAIFQGKPEIQHLNPAGTVHGGWMANLLDSAMGSAVMSSLPKNKTFYVTTKIEDIEYFRSMPRTIGRVRCLAEVSRVNSSEREVAVGAHILDAEGSVYAVAKGFYRVGRGAYA